MLIQYPRCVEYNLAVCCGGRWVTPFQGQTVHAGHLWLGAHTSVKVQWLMRVRAHGFHRIGNLDIKRSKDLLDSWNMVGLLSWEEWGHFCLVCYAVSQLCLTFCDPMDCSTQGLPVLHHLPDCSNSCPSSQWCHPNISSSITRFSHLQSFPVSRSFPMSQLFALDGQNSCLAKETALCPWAVVRLSSECGQKVGFSGVTESPSLGRAALWW